MAFQLIVYNYSYNLKALYKSQASSNAVVRTAVSSHRLSNTGVKHARPYPSLFAEWTGEQPG